MIRFGAALLLLAAIAVTILAFLRHRESYRQLRSAYAAAVTAHDIADSARDAFSSLSDAQIRAENYVLTGKASYFDAFKEDVRSWEDASGTLAAVAATGPSVAPAKEFLKTGTRTRDELDSVISLYQTAGRQPAMERIASGSSTICLDQTRKHLTETLDTVTGGLEGATPVLGRGLRSTGRQWIYAFALFSIACAATILLLLDRPAHYPRKS